MSKGEALHYWTVIYNKAYQYSDKQAMKQADQRIRELFRGLPKQPIK